MIEIYPKDPFKSLDALQHECRNYIDSEIRYRELIKEHDSEIRRKTIDELLYRITEGFDEGIRCALCTNTMKSDRGCDGSCVVDDSMYEKVMEVIRHNLQYAEQMKGEME